MSFKIWVQLALTDVTITPCYTMVAGGICTVTVYADTLVDTDVTVSFQVTDDLSGTFGDSVVIANGTNNSTSGNINLTNGSATATQVDISSISPNPSSGQSYSAPNPGYACI
jgi:hypothetical protein